MEEVSNADLKESFDKHSADDKLFQDAQGVVNEEFSKSLAALHQRLGDVATKEDVDELKNLLKAVRIGTGVFSYTFNNAAKIGSYILLLIAVFGVIKYGVWGAAMWFFKLINGA